VHLGALAGVQDCRVNPELAFVQNIHSTFGYLRYAATHGVTRFVYASSAAAAVPNTLYGASKAAAEALVGAYRKEYGLDTCIVRIANVYGPGSRDKNSAVARMCKDALRRNQVVIEGDGKQMRSFVHITLLCDALDLVCIPDAGYRLQVQGIIEEVGAVAEYIARRTGAEIVYAPARPNDSLGGYDQSWPQYNGNAIDLYEGIDETLEYFRGL